MYDLIITEKPSAAKKIANALADGKAIIEKKNGVSYYKVTHGNKDIVIVCAVGHLYGLKQKQGKKSEFPVFDIEWAPVADINKNSAFTRKYLSTIKSLSKDASEYTVATDYDIEGEVIGLNVVRYACKQKNAKRMKFSTLTKDELISSYEHSSPSIDWGQANAGETRHKLDWFYGINASRALTNAISSQGSFKMMSTGRVQGPALKLIVDKEKEIEAFKPVPFWLIEMDSQKEAKPIISWHKKDKFWDKAKADAVMDKIKAEKECMVKDITKKEFKVAPPFPFDLTSLQLEAHKCLKISPKKTLEIAQELYTSSYISYPRTSSQELPKSIGYKKVITLLGRQSAYSEIAKKLLKGNLTPNNGKKKDPAHPAIYPTGIVPAGLEEKEQKVYDLIARRFLATFGKSAIRETLRCNFEIKEEIFVTKGSTTKFKGWHEIYAPYVMLKEEELPNVEKGEILPVIKIKLHDKETSPPKRFTEASIIKELEKRGLGTKATRASIIDTLFQRGYVDGKPIHATDLGIRTIETLDKYSPTLTDQELTRHFEDEMELIRQNKEKPEKVLDEAKTAIRKLAEEFTTNKAAIAKELSSANRDTEDKKNYIGKCPDCGGKLMIKRGKYGKFVGCSNYPECKTVYKLPNTGMIKNYEKLCEKCNAPMILVIKKGKRPQELCINPDCESKGGSIDKIDKKCPKCGSDLIIRSSIYGKFIGCSNFPKCKYTEQISSDSAKKDSE